MAYMNQEKKATIKANLDKFLKGTNVKYSLKVRNHSTIVCTIKSAPVNFIQNFIDVARKNNDLREDQIKYIEAHQNLDVNQYWFKEHYDGKARELLEGIIAALYSADWYDNSDIQTDYFNTAYYIDVNIGSWKKPFVVTK